MSKPEEDLIPLQGSPVLPHVRGKLHPLVAALEHIDRVAQVFLMALMTVIIAVVSAQVFLRYLFNSSIGWADEVSRLAFVWSIFIAIPLGVREGLHIGIQIVTVRLPGLVRETLARATAAAGMVLMLMVSYQAVIIAWDQWDEKMSSVDMSAAMFVVAVAVGCTYSALWLACIALTGKSYSTGLVGVE
jgi:TRAP-type C4-dicarboxylate transport system permease small subunit